ncbi:hypothetical protein ANN_17645 [Periplaneta americana]|uniref:Uncharacterized protein n=1 Tax=Periplaneta americana TaxID=6978 RepID=A0ABQ8STI2_PERAM|nr:hypothetical protein ANN_17645 [Periplaneta americana]
MQTEKIVDFYLGQMFWRNIQDFDLSRMYKQKDSEINHFLKFSSDYVPKPQPSIRMLTDDVVAIKPKVRRVDDFCDFILLNYIMHDNGIVEVNFDSAMAPSFWSENVRATIKTDRRIERRKSYSEGEIKRKDSERKQSGLNSQCNGVYCWCGWFYCVCRLQSALENRKIERELGGKFKRYHIREGAEIDQLITERGEEELAGVCRWDGKTPSSVVR